MLGSVAQAEGWHISTQFVAALPYIGTVVVLCARAPIGKVVRRQPRLANGARRSLPARRPSHALRVGRLATSP
ncbi:MAG: hypothetical protein AB7V58_06070 [Solirubrobacterales bacterium]